MIIMKFGGTSVGSVDAIRQVRSVVEANLQRGPVVVVSAVSGVTNLLQEFITADDAKRSEIARGVEEKHQEIMRGLEVADDELVATTLHGVINGLGGYQGELTAQDKDEVLSIGERLSSVIVSAYFSRSFDSRAVDAREILMTDSAFGAAEIIDEQTRAAIDNKMPPLMESGQTLVVTGFIARSTAGETTTLGRGGSDYTAALLGHYMGADEIQIWTDVNGVYSTDPRDDSRAVLLPEITYQEVGELAAFGAKVLHPKTMRPAVMSQIPIVIVNTFDPEGPTTRVVEATSQSGSIIAVASKKQITMVNVYAVEMLLEKGFLARISSIFADNNISIDLISATETSVSMTLDNHEKLESAVNELKQFSRVSVDENVGLVTLIGQGLPAQPARLTQIFNRLAEQDISTKMISVGAQNVNVSVVVAKDRVMEAIAATHALCLEQRGDAS